MAQGKGKTKSGSGTRRCGHRVTEVDRCTYCGSVTAEVCGVHFEGDQRGCWTIVRRFAHRPGCRLEAHHAGRPVYVPNPNDKAGAAGPCLDPAPGVPPDTATSSLQRAPG